MDADFRTASVADRVMMIPQGNANRPGRKLNGGKPAKITIHETANTDPGANAAMHGNFLRQGGGPEGVSFHFAVDDHESIQFLPLDEVAWHAGDGRWGPGNSTSLAIEVCVNSDGNWQTTLTNLVKLVVKLLALLDMTVGDDVVQHNHWSGKDCPHQLRQSGWGSLMARISAGASGRVYPQTGHTVAGEFLRFFDAGGGVPVYGYPISDERDEQLSDGKSYRVQWFERARLELHPEMGPGVVMAGLVGAELFRKLHAA